MTDQAAFPTRNPLVPLAAGFAAGLALGRYGPAPPHPWLIFLAAIPPTAILCRPGCRLGAGWKVGIFTLLFLLAGLVRFSTITRPILPATLSNLADSGRGAVLLGRLREANRVDGNRGRLLVTAEELRQPNGDRAPLHQPRLLRLPFPPPADLAPGDLLILRTTLHRPAPPGNPGTFDYRRYLAEQGILLTGFLRAPACIAKVHREVGADSAPAVFPYRIQRLRQHLNRFIASSPLTPADAGLYQALLTGDREGVPKQVKEDFTNTGTVHLLAISGMHLGLLALFSTLLINMLLKRSAPLLLRFPARKITAALVLLILAAYAILTGMKPPVLRALIMAAALIGALLLDRPPSPANSLGLAALITLVWQPEALFSPSFQLSYLAVGGILVLLKTYPSLIRPLRNSTFSAAGLRRLFSNGLLVSLAAMAATAPLTIIYFHRLSLLSPLATILVAPLLCLWALPLGLTALCLAGILPAPAHLLLHIGGWGLTAARHLTGFLAALPLSSWETPHPPWFLLPLYYLGLAVFLFGRHLPRLRTLVLPPLLLVLVLVMFRPPVGPGAATSRVTFMDVGQGAATLLELPGGHNILVDGGTAGAEDFDPGAELIGPYLNYRNLDHLEAIVVSHDHADHYNGLGYMVRHFHPETLWLNGSANLSPGLAGIVAAASAAGCRVRVPAAGETLLTTPKARLICLSDFHLENEPRHQENGRSLVLELDSGGHRLLLPGDIMAEEGEELLAAGKIRPCDLLLAPHHGSDGSATLALTQACHPDWLIVAAGASKEGRFPGPKVLAWVGKRKIHLHDTGRSGAITFDLIPGALNWQTLSEKADRL